MTSPSSQADPRITAPVGSPAGGPESLRSVPGWVLRLVLGAAAVAAALLVISSDSQARAPGVAQVLMVFAAAVAALAPGTVVPLAVMVGLVLFRLAAGGPILDGTLVVLVALLPLIHQLAGAAAAIPARSKCRWTALRPAMIRYAIAVLPVEIALVAVILVR